MIRYLVLLLLLAGPAQAATKYLRSGATGANNGNNCTDAYTSLATLESNLARGDTGYIAEGSYSGTVFNPTNSGASYITIKNATGADHGPGAGWDDAYGDAQAVIAGPIYIASSYWVFDGATGGGPGPNFLLSSAISHLLTGQKDVTDPEFCADISFLHHVYFNPCGQVQQLAYFRPHHLWLFSHPFFRTQCLYISK